MVQQSKWQAFDLMVEGSFKCSVDKLSTFTYSNGNIPMMAGLAVSAIEAAERAMEGWT